MAENQSDAQVNNEEISNNWKKEFLSSGLDVSQKMADYCIAELRYKSVKHIKSAQTPIVVMRGDVVKSDTAVSSDLRQALKKAVTAFEDKIPERLKDWHPGSDGLVWDLVHPSLFPLVYGRSRILSSGLTTTVKDCVEKSGQGEKIPKIHEKLHSGYSQRFQWLPCEVDISGSNAKYCLLF